ncbi:hypothetical protein [Kibdelosporangium aridum]|uniref:hypothetical protein n=1 Tax=Kibdelosporangium aridum TaxID=2030 RepID=UPI0035E647FF
MLRSHGWRPIEVSGFDPAEMHEAYAEALASSVADIRQIQTDARRGVRGTAADWPMVVLRTPMLPRNCRAANAANPNRRSLAQRQNWSQVNGPC